MKKRKLHHDSPPSAPPASQPVIPSQSSVPMSALAFRKLQQQEDISQSLSFASPTVSRSPQRSVPSSDSSSSSENDEVETPDRQDAELTATLVTRSPKRQRRKKDLKKGRYYAPTVIPNSQQLQPSRPPSALDDARSIDDAFPVARRPLSPPPPAQYEFSKWQPQDGVNFSRLNVEEEEVVLIGLKTAESLVVCGNLEISVLSGTLKINCYSYNRKLSNTAETFQIAAPLNSPLPVLAHPKGSEYDLEAFTHSNLQGTFTCIISLKDSGNALEYLEESLQRRGGIWPLPAFLEEQFIALSSRAHCWGIVSGMSFPPHPPVIPASQHESWTSCLNDLEEKDDRLTVFITGARRVGKSTFNREAVNTLLTRYERVAWLETDLGQGEIGAGGGCVSLAVRSTPVIGPSWTDFDGWQIRKAVWLGVHSPSDFPLTYQKAIEECFQLYVAEVQYGTSEEEDNRIPHWMEDVATPVTETPLRKKRKDFVPLVVNTHGWNKGLGGDLVRFIDDLVRPTVRGRFLEPWELDCPHSSRPPSSTIAKELYSLLPSPLSPRWPPPLLRSLALYAHFRPKSHIYSLPLRNLRLVTMTSAELPENDKLAAMLGTVVALCDTEGQMKGLGVFWAATEDRAFVMVGKGKEKELENVVELRGGKGKAWNWEVPDESDSWREGEKRDRRRPGVRRWNMG
ncbi:hypothetical protein BT69DRAFT_1332798 [Atractiella rhizophila]|nr:hypothetical protein BT69DRAFT_1332798 [Atractiella rhizophila]